MTRLSKGGTKYKITFKKMLLLINSNINAMFLSLKKYCNNTDWNPSI